jgi:hypothetical protein
LTTYRGGNRPRKAGDREIAQPVLGDSEGGLW